MGSYKVNISMNLDHYFYYSACNETQESKQYIINLSQQTLDKATESSSKQKKNVNRNTSAALPLWFNDLLDFKWIWMLQRCDMTSIHIDSLLIYIYFVTLQHCCGTMNDTSLPLLINYMGQPIHWFCRNLNTFYHIGKNSLCIICINPFM